MLTLGDTEWRVYRKPTIFAIFWSLKLFQYKKWKMSIREWKSKPQSEKRYFEIHISDDELVSIICTEHL